MLNSSCIPCGLIAILFACAGQAIKEQNLFCFPQIEQEVCLQTAGFEDFVLQFMDRCFALIENSTLEQITQLDRETEKMNRDENMLEMGLSSTFSAILTQAHPKIYQVIL